MAKGDGGQEKAIYDNGTRLNNQYNDLTAGSKDQLAGDRNMQDAERNTISSGYQGLIETGGIDPSAANRLLSGDYSGVPGASGGSGGGGGGGVSSSYPDYINTFNDLSSKTGGYDPTRLSNVTDTSSKLKNFSSQYGDTDTSIKGLQDFAASGGVSSQDSGDITNDTLRNLAATGGYSDGDIANIRARSNSNLMSTYANLKDNLNRSQLRGSSVGPGMSGAQFKLARQGAQDLGTNVQNNEVGIRQAVNAGKLSGGTALSNAALGLAGLKSNNTLTGYNDAGQLANTKAAGVEQGLADSGNLDNQTQSLINQSRLSAAGGLSQDALGRMSIGAQSSAAQNALNATNQRFLINEADQTRLGALSGYTNLYGTAPGVVGQDEQYNLKAWEDLNSATQGNIGLGIANHGKGTDWGSLLGTAGTTVAAFA